MTRPGARSARTIEELLDTGRETIGEASDTPELDARLLLQTLLDKDHAWLIAHHDEAVEAGAARRFHHWIQRRARSEPVAYITGRKAFWTLELAVTPEVLVPRPETELLVERALERIPLSEPLHILDLGTGSGAIALSIASERPLCKVIATDRSTHALKIAERNKARLGLRNIDFQPGDWYQAVGGQRFSVILCNPPYVPHSHYEATLAYEPQDALFAGHQGLDALQTVIEGAAAHLEPGGWLILEHGHDQRQAVHSLLANAGFDALATLHDYAGHPRITEARSPAKP